jgi:integrase
LAATCSARISDIRLRLAAADASSEALTDHGRYVFPSMLGGDRSVSDNTVNTALRRLGYDKDIATAHGFRAMARTLMVEKLIVRPLAHHRPSLPMNSARS